MVGPFIVSSQVTVVGNRPMKNKTAGIKTSWTVGEQLVKAPTSPFHG